MADLQRKRLQWYRREPLGGHACFQDISDFLAHGARVAGVPAAVVEELEAHLLGEGFRR